MTGPEAFLRNIGIIAHINAGKTTLTERILYLTGAQRFLGEVDDGTATMDFMAEEQRRGISISAAVAHVRWHEHGINLIDMPGHVDFTAEVERCLRVLDGVVVLLDGVRGVESQTETVWNQAERHGIPRLVFVNKMDRPGADFTMCLESLRETFGCRPVPIVLPLRESEEFVGLVQVLEHRVSMWAGADEPPFSEEALHAVEEICADLDDGILEDLVHENPIMMPRLHEALRRAALEGRVVPVVAGAALPNHGVESLLDAVCRYLPSPLELPPVRCVKTDSVTRPPSRGAPFCGLVFKSLRDGEERLLLVRVYSGVLRAGDRVATTARDEPFGVERLWRVHALDREVVEQAFPGDVVAMPWVPDLRTGDTLFSPGAPICLEPVEFPAPVLSMVLEPRTRADAPAVEKEARILVDDDPTLHLDLGAETGELRLAGMGELHLEVFGSRLQRRIGPRVRLTRPRVALLETVAAGGVGEAECRLRNTQGAWCTARLKLAIEPAPGLGTFWIVDDTGGGPDEARHGVLQELTERARIGLAHSYPATDLKIRLLEIEVEEPGESGVLLALEALDVALRKALAEAGSVLLEPIVRCEVRCPADTLAGVLGDLQSRGARISAVHRQSEAARVRGRLPLSAALGYTTRLRSLTRGLGSLALEPDGFAPQGVLEAGSDTGCEDP